MVREMAEEIRGQFRSSTPDSTIFTSYNQTNGPLGKEWVSNFLHQHSELKSVVGKAIQTA